MAPRAPDVMAKKYLSTLRPGPTSVRINTHTRDRLRAYAARRRRSVNYIILELIEDGLREAGFPPAIQPTGEVHDPS